MHPLAVSAQDIESQADFNRIPKHSFPLPNARKPHRSQQAVLQSPPARGMKSEPQAVLQSLPARRMLQSLPARKVKPKFYKHSMTYKSSFKTSLANLIVFGKRRTTACHRMSWRSAWGELTVLPRAAFHDIACEQAQGPTDTQRRKRSEVA